LRRCKAISRHSREKPQVEESFTLENPWLLKATLSADELQARLGSMVAYQGEFRFERARAGWRRIFKRTLTPEGGRLMRVSGTGEVFLAQLAQQVYRLHLDDEESPATHATCSPSRAASTGTSAAFGAASLARWPAASSTPI
jgi:hypothetical protein